MSKSTVKQPRCLTCKDTGQVMGLDASSFEARNTWLVCPDCPPKTPYILGQCADWIAYVIWGGAR